LGSDTYMIRRSNINSGAFRFIGDWRPGDRLDGGVKANEIPLMPDSMILFIVPIEYHNHQNNNGGN
jgi:hypothetical protein